ncbi:MAG: DUF4832 domain-containing protein [Oscillospiraceae bacterium]|nr:DUF4832 domain-containing protein [Oscillospiraceae bacterium]
MIKKFNEKKGVITNPYIGFTSFQHFRGEALYSDCITGRSGMAGTETENYECYPVPEGVEQNGREQGYYPDTTVAYIRILWKEFEPRQGEYNYAFIEEILKKAKAKGQTVMFRLMPHSTCARDDVPNWLREIMPCPERPDGMRVKDSPTDPRYLKLFGAAIEKLGQRFDSDETLDCVDVSLGGAWGEGGQDFAEEDMKALMDVYVRVFPNTKLLGQLGNTAMLEHIGAQRPIGCRADGTGEPRHTNELFPARFAALGEENWKTAPVSFESYWWISEWHRQGWDIDDIIEKTLSWHLSTFNTKSFPIPYELQEKIEYWLEKMGYRFVAEEFEYPESAAAGERVECSLKIKNAGVAPIYNKLPLKLRFKGESFVWEWEAPTDIRSWLPGEWCEKLEISLPADMPKGSYEISCAIGGGEYPVVQLATETETDGEYYTLAEIKVK